MLHPKHMNVYTSPNTKLFPVGTRTRPLNVITLDFRGDTSIPDRFVDLCKALQEMSGSD
jgi:hypothetical protein